MKILDEWLGEQAEHFLRHDFGRRPCSRPHTARAALGICGWRNVETMLCSHADPDVLLVARGREVASAVPRSLDELGFLFARGVGIVVRHAERLHAALRQYCAALAQDVPGEQRVLIFATPRGVHGFGWHYDAEEVFIVQTAGRKDYYFRANTIDPEPRRGAQPDFSRIREETTPLMGCTLLAGDWLYLPRGYWHVAMPMEDSLSISIGIFPA